MQPQGQSVEFLTSTYLELTGSGGEPA